MKRLLSLILACLLLCAPVLAETAAPDAISPEAAPICGVWTLSSLVTGGVAINPGMYGLSMTLTFHADGTFVSDDGQRTTTAAWQLADDVITAGNATLTLREDGALSLVSGANTMVFTQIERFTALVAPTPTPTTTPTTAPSSTPVPTPSPTPTLSPADARAPFIGVWTLSSVITGGVTLNPALYGMTMTLNLHADGTFVSDDGQQTVTAVWQLTDGVITAGNATLTPGEDCLTLVSGSNTMIFTRPEAPVTPAPTSTPAPTATLPPEIQSFTGTWYMCYNNVMDYFGIIGDLRSLGVTGTLTLQPNFTGRHTIKLTGAIYLDETSVWFVSDGTAVFGTELTPLTLLDTPDGPFLRVGTEEEYMIYHRSKDAVWSPDAVTVSNAPPLHYGVPYYCTSYKAYGFVVPVGEDEGPFSITFQQNGQCSISMPEMPTLYQPYSFHDGAYRTNYLGESFAFVPTSIGLDLDMQGITLCFTPLQAAP